MRKIFSTLLVILSISSFAQSHKEAKDILSKAKEAISQHKNQKLTFDYSMDRPGQGGKKTITYSGSLVVAGEKYRLEMNDFEYLCDGTKIYTISKADLEITSSKIDEENSAPITPSSILNSFDKGFSYKLAGTEKVGKRTVQYITLKPNVTDQVREITLGIFTDDYSVHSFKRMGTNDVDIRFEVKESAWDVKLPATYLTFVASDYSDYIIFD